MDWPMSVMTDLLWPVVILPQTTENPQEQVQQRTRTVVFTQDDLGHQTKEVSERSPAFPDEG